MIEKELRVQKIKEGIVIDHLRAGSALKVLELLGITGKEGFVITVAMNVPSQKLGTKDIIKIEGRYLSPSEVSKVALLAPKATLNIIKDYKVEKKERLKFPEKIVGIVRCSNPTCVTNHEPHIQSRFSIISHDPLKIKCEYCETVMTQEEITKMLS
ncbi:MAG: aspartate carbamoyltransferase regulatory subunit [Candidatus Nezhaarchaeota archaeon]|nr:aspartate carbamoyltransferase regulatory subunit [Candidatus Nezhaarchaeota archaeon]MCX8142060.1 aspartate carbamoyltransferase regulatory subunit [Candidatus Nezhaarchaeota archaeon]MDW8050159.1 aspartate carbamoyltransferase regulatory subunit [Nitrososphaerota archaeon]